MNVASSSSTTQASADSNSTPVALLEHLHSTLAPLLALDAVPSDVRDILARYVKTVFKDSSAEIPYALLQRVSRWSVRADGRQALRDASLDPEDYTMLSLLAGTVTSPSARLGRYVPPPTALEVRRAQVRDRRAVIAIINALFSIAGVGVAAWHASKTTTWTPSTRILLAVVSGFIVAVAEGGLYLIWSNRSSERAERRPQTVRDKISPPIVSLDIPAVADMQEEPPQQVEATDGLRRRL